MLLTSLQNVYVIDNEWIVIKIQNYIILLTEWISVTSFVCLVSNLFIIYQNKNKHIENCTCNELSYHYQTLHFIYNQIRKPRAMMMHEIKQWYRMLTNHGIVAIREKICWIIILNSFKRRNCKISLMKSSFCFQFVRFQYLNILFIFLNNEMNKTEYVDWLHKFL